MASLSIREDSHMQLTLSASCRDGGSRQAGRFFKEDRSYLGGEGFRHTSSSSDDMPHIIGGSMTVRKIMQEA